MILYSYEDILAELQAAEARFDEPAKCKACEQVLALPIRNKMRYTRQNDYGSIGVYGICWSCTDGGCLGNVYDEYGLLIESEKKSLMPGRPIGILDSEGYDICEDSVLLSYESLYIVEYRPPKFAIVDTFGRVWDLYISPDGYVRPHSIVIGNRWEPKYRELFGDK